MFVRKQVESKRVPMINIGTLFICYVLYPGFFKQTVSVVRMEKPLNFDPFGHAELSLFAKI